MIQIDKSAYVAHIYSDGEMFGNIFFDYFEEDLQFYRFRVNNSIDWISFKKDRVELKEVEE